jgi:hypothetical protein
MSIKPGQEWGDFRKKTGRGEKAKYNDVQSNNFVFDGDGK